MMSLLNKELRKDTQRICLPESLFGESSSCYLAHQAIHRSTPTRCLLSSSPDPPSALKGVGSLDSTCGFKPLGGPKVQGTLFLWSPPWHLPPQVDLFLSCLSAWPLEFLSYSMANVNLQISEDVNSEDRAMLDSSLSLPGSARGPRQQHSNTFVQWMNNGNSS